MCLCCHQPGHKASVCPGERPVRSTCGHQHDQVPEGSSGQKSKHCAQCKPDGHLTMDSTSSPRALFLLKRPKSTQPPLGNADHAAPRDVDHAAARAAGRRPRTTSENLLHIPQTERTPIPRATRKRIVKPAACACTTPTSRTRTWPDVAPQHPSTNNCPAYRGNMKKNKICMKRT